MIGSSLLWEMMLWLSVSVILKNKAALDTQKGANLGLKCARMHLAAGLRPDPLEKLERSPRPLAAMQEGGVPISKGKGSEGNGKGKEGEGRVTCIPPYYKCSYMRKKNFSYASFAILRTCYSLSYAKFTNKTVRTKFSE